jgi:hypothetical protein
VAPVVYPAALTREWQVALGVLVCAVNVAIYVLLWCFGRGRGLLRSGPG